MNTVVREPWRTRLVPCAEDYLVPIAIFALVEIIYGDCQLLFDGPDGVNTDVAVGLAAHVALAVWLWAFCVLPLTRAPHHRPAG